MWPFMFSCILNVISCVVMMQVQGSAGHMYYWKIGGYKRPFQIAIVKGLSLQTTEKCIIHKGYGDSSLCHSMPVTHWNFTVNVMLKRSQFIYETVRNELVNVGLKRSVSFASLIWHCMMCDKKLFSCYDITEKEYCGIFLLRSCTNFLQGDIFAISCFWNASPLQKGWLF